MNDIGLAAAGQLETARRETRQLESGQPEAGQPEAPGQLRQDAAELLAAIGGVRRTVRRAVRGAWSTEPLPVAQAELLRLIAVKPGISVAEAAHELHVAPNTVSTLVGRLAELGLMHRERSQPDGRSVRLTVTPKAAQRIASWRDLRAELASQALASLPPGDRETLMQAIPALLRLTGVMEEQ